MSSPILEAALHYAQLGWRILPLHNLESGICSCGRTSCRRGGKDEKSIAKHPRTHNWQIDATCDETSIAAWWRQWPRANVGIATGRVSNLVVLDVDVHRDKPGFVSLDVLESLLGKLPRTRTAQTGSGGQHQLFRYPLNLGVLPDGSPLIVCNSANWRGGAGIDWRADGGQIVVAPSVAAAGAYSWLDLADVAELPAAWIEAHRQHELARWEKRSRETRAPRPDAPSASPAAATLVEDDDIIGQIHTAANSEKAVALWEGRWEKLYDSQSEADLALCSILAFWCDPEKKEPDLDRIDRLFRRSALYREKWERDDYREDTIAMAADLEEKRRTAEEAKQAHVEGVGEVTVAAERARLLQNSPQPSIPAPPGINDAHVKALVRALVRKKRNSESPQSKFDSDLIENFMAGEDLVSAVAVTHNLALAAFRGMDGLARVAWILGNALPPELPWDAVLGARPAAARVPQMPAMLQKAEEKYTASQLSRMKWEATQKEKDAAQEEQRLAERKQRRQAAQRNFDNLLKKTR
jgi:hypothetical protein